MRPWRATALAVALALLVPSTVRATEGPLPGFAAALARARRSLVCVTSVYPVEQSPMPMEPEAAVFSNVGFFVSSEGDVLTSLLGVAGCRDITVQCADGRKGRAEVVAGDQAAGLALLKTDLGRSEPLELREGRPPSGQWILLPSLRSRDGRLALTAQPALLWDFDAPVRLHGVEWRELMVSTLAVGAGSAAAPLLDEQGRVAAVVLGVQSEGAGGGPYECLSMPADIVAPILSRLRRGESRRLGWLGLAVVREPGGREGLTVTGVLDESPAHLAGVRVGDVLLAVEDEVLWDPSVLAEHVSLAAPGTSMSLKLLRDGQVRTAEVKIGERPLLICSSARPSAQGTILWRWRRTVLPPSGLNAWDRAALEELLEENLRLRRRVDILEERLRQLERD